MAHVMNEVFSAFENADIRYAHFKSNTNLDESFSGKGDFDVIADPERLHDIEEILLAHAGKRYEPKRIGVYPGVCNWLVFDGETGIYHHLHLHYQLATGKYLVKEYALPWRELILDNAVTDPVYGIRITHPAMELVLLLARMVVKSSFRERGNAALGSYTMRKGFRKEYDDLLSKAEKDDIEKFAGMMFKGPGREAVMKIVSGSGMSAADYRMLSRAVREELAGDRRMGGFKAACLSRYYSLRQKYAKFINRRTGKCAVIKKTADKPGHIIAFVGVDGAGKSTTTAEICKWMAKKIECRRFYMGSGDGRLPFMTKVLRRVGSKKKRKVRTIYAIEKSNAKKLRRMHVYRMNGGTSLLDRYPQIEMPGQNDGPKMESCRERVKDDAFIDSMAAKEAKALSVVKEVKPDVVFRLNITLEVSMARKPEQKNPEVYQQKIDDLKSITFQGAEIIDIDASQPYEQELLEIKRILWERFL